MIRPPVYTSVNNPANVKYVTNICIDIPNYLLDLFSLLINKDIVFKLGYTIDNLVDTGYGSTNRDTEFRVLEYELLNILHKTLIEIAVSGVISQEDIYHLINMNMENYINTRYGRVYSEMNGLSSNGLYAGLENVNLVKLTEYTDAVNHYIINYLRLLIAKDEFRFPLHMCQHYADRMELLINNPKALTVVLTYPDPLGPYAYDYTFNSCMVYLTLDLSED
jgi:hypothetical protein